MLAKACRLEGLMLSMLSSELPFMVVEWCSTPSPKNFRLKTLLSNSNSSIQLAVLVWYTVSLFPQEVVMFSLSSYLKMVVSLCDSCLFITIHLPVVVSCSCSPRSPPPFFFQPAILLSPKLSLSLPAQLSFVAAPNTMTAPETPTSTKTQCLLIPEWCEKGQEYKEQEKREKQRK